MYWHQTACGSDRERPRGVAATCCTISKSDKETAIATPTVAAMPCINTMHRGAQACLADDSEEVCDDLVLGRLDGSKSLEHHRQRRACTCGDHAQRRRTLVLAAQTLVYYALWPNSAARMSDRAAAGRPF